ncbi:MAG TPA: cupin domain-containing protein [Gaiellales bacterium]|nr:cupin domain-containing protein [Gaiellales bacterium]
MSPVIDVEQLRTSATTHLMEGHAYGAGVSFFLIEYPPGRGNSLHRHPYAEVFIVQEGEALFTVGDSEVPGPRRQRGGGAGRRRAPVPGGRRRHASDDLHSRRRRDADRVAVAG